MLVKARIGSPGRPVVPVGEVDRRLLVHHLDRPDLIAALVEHVGQRPAAVARDAGDDLHALAHQVLDDDLRAGQSSRLQSGSIGLHAHGGGGRGRVAARVPWWRVSPISSRPFAARTDERRGDTLALTRGRRAVAARREPARADDRDDADRHLERLVRSRRARVRDQLRGDRRDAPTRRSSPTSGERSPDTWHGRVAELARRASGLDRGRARLGDRRRDVRPGRPLARAGLRGDRRAQGPALDADRPDLFGSAERMLEQAAGFVSSRRTSSSSSRRRLPGSRHRGGDHARASAST